MFAFVVLFSIAIFAISAFLIALMIIVSRFFKKYEDEVLEIEDSLILIFKGADTISGFLNTITRNISSTSSQISTVLVNLINDADSAVKMLEEIKGPLEDGVGAVQNGVSILEKATSGGVVGAVNDAADTWNGVVSIASDIGHSFVGELKKF